MMGNIRKVSGLVKPVLKFIGLSFGLSLTVFYWVESIVRCIKPPNKNTFKDLNKKIVKRLKLN